MTTTDSTTAPESPAEVGQVQRRVRPCAYAVMAFGRVQQLAVRADIADELACKWRESDPKADLMPLYGPEALRRDCGEAGHKGREAIATLASERDANAALTGKVEQLQKTVARLRAALWHVQYTAKSLADAQVIALESKRPN